MSYILRLLFLSMVWTGFIVLTAIAADTSKKASGSTTQSSLKQSDSHNKVLQNDIIASIQSNIKTLNEGGGISKKALVTQAQRSLGPSALAIPDSQVAQDHQSVQDSIPTKILTKLNVVREDDITKVSLIFERGTPFYAVFARDNTYYIVLSHPSDFQVEKYDDHQIKNLEKITHFDTPDALVIKLKFRQKLYPKIVYLEEKETVVLDFFYKLEGEERVKDIIPPPDSITPFKIRQPNGRIALDIIDEEDKCQLWVICASRTIGAHSSLHLRHYPEFDILDSYQGVALLLHDNDLMTNFVNASKIAEISKARGLAVSSLRYQSVAATPTALFQEFNEKIAPGRIIELMQSAASKRIPIREYLEIIWLNIGLGKIPEAISIINRLKELSPDLSLIPAFRAMDGLSQLLMGRGEKAESILAPLSYDAEPHFWAIIGGAIKSYETRKNGTLAQDGRDVFRISDYAYQLPQHQEKLLLLPPPLIENLLSQILQVGIQQNNKEVLKTFTATEFKPKQMQDTIGFYKLAKALIGIFPGQKESAKILKELIGLYMNPKVAVIAEFELLKFQHQEKEIKSRQELAALERLRFRWRGDLLEYQISTYLADRYIEEKQYHRALPILRKIIKYYPRNSYDDKLPQKMKKALILYFSQEPSPPALQALSIFQEFGDIAPDNQDGDMVMLLATNQLVQLKLYEEAIDIIQTYVKEKIKAIPHQQERKNKLFYRMGVIHFLNKQPKQTLDMLQSVKEATPELQIDVNLLKSESYRYLNDYQQAIHVLGESIPELTRRASLHFMREEWAEAAACYQKIIDSVEKISQDIKANAVVQRALCHNLLRDEEGLREIKKQHAPLVKGTKYQAKFDFLMTPLEDDQHQKKEKQEQDIAEAKSLQVYMENIKKIFKKS